MNAREQIKRAVLLIPKLAAESESKEIKADIDLLMGVASQLMTVVVNRNTQLAKQTCPSRAKAPKTSPAKAPKQPKRPPSSTDNPSSQNDTKDRPKELSSIQQGILQADTSLADQQRALRQQIYGQQNDDVAFAKAAKAIAS
jgi:hypothetical protein